MATVEGTDPITVSVIQHRLESIVEEMGEAMFRTSYSQLLNSSRDFSLAILGADGRMIAQSAPIPIHVGGLPWAGRSILEGFSDRIYPGDVFVLNDPYHGNTHLADLTVFVPVFSEGRLAFWCVNRAHQSDIGGGAHGGYSPEATEIWQEGLRIPPLKLYSKGDQISDVLYLIQTNVRHSGEFRGDVLAMLGSAKTGERRLQGLIDEYTPATVAAAIEVSLDGAERQARSCVAEWRDGVYQGEAVIDDDGHGSRDISVRATVTKTKGSVVIDLSDSDPQVAGFINSTLPTTYSAAALAYAFMLDPDIAKNDGAFRPLTVVAKPGTIVWANPPAPVGLCTGTPAMEIEAAILKALAPASPRRSIAGWSKRFRIALQGVDPRSDRPFLWHMFHARGGGGASASGDGWSTAGEFNSVGAIKVASIEVTEARFPLFFVHHEFRPDSGGDGTYRGGLGATMDLRVEADAVASTAGDGVRHCSYGLFGGREGRPFRYVLKSTNGKQRLLTTKASGIRINQGDILQIQSAGGGGWGDPSRRDQAARAEDRRNGFVTQRPSRPRKRAASPADD